MEYAKLIDAENSNGLLKSDLYTKYVGYQDTNSSIELFFNKETVKTISHKITQLLMGVHPENRPIVVPDTTIYNVMDNIYYAYRPPTGDIYGRYNVPTGTTTRSYVQDMIDQVIEVIVSDVKTTYETDANNAKLSVWTTVLGNFNDNGLRAHPVIKTLLKRPAPFQFNMNY
jgi:hypothetical protein